MSDLPNLTEVRAAAAEWQAAVWSHTVEQAAQGLAFADELHAIAQQWSAILALQRMEQAQSTLLQLLPSEILSSILSKLEDLRDLARLAATCRLLWCDAAAAPERRIGPVEAELRRRAEARRLDIGFALPQGAASWVPFLLKRELREVLRRRVPLAVEAQYCVFVDREGHLLTCGSNRAAPVPVLVYEDALSYIARPTLVPSMLNTRIVSVAAGFALCLALSAEGCVFSWGCGSNGRLGHGDSNNRETPTRIASLECIESISAGASSVSGAIDDRGRLFTWGWAGEESPMTNGLGYEVDPETQSQPTPTRVDALSQGRVVSLAIGRHFTLAVTDAGAVFSCGRSKGGVLGYDSLVGEVLPRRVDALTQTGRRFVAVAAGARHALALTEEGQLYGWGLGDFNGHRLGTNRPLQVTV